MKTSIISTNGWYYAELTDTPKGVRVVIWGKTSSRGVWKINSQDVIDKPFGVVCDHTHEVLNTAPIPEPVRPARDKRPALPSYWIIESDARGVFDGFDFRPSGFIPTWHKYGRREEARKFLSVRAAQKELIEVNKHLGHKPARIVAMGDAWGLPTKRSDTHEKIRK